MAARDSDMFPPARVHHIVDEFERHMRTARDKMGLANAIYLNEFWAWWIGHVNGTRSGGSTLKQNGSEIEVNRLWKEVSTYRAALYPRANRVVCGPDPMGRGDERVGTAAMNAWWAKRDTHRRVTAGVDMALMFPGCAFKVGYDPGRGSPIERAWCRIVPPWEVVLDRNVTDLADERYRGHLYTAPKEEVEARYPKLRGKLTGTRRSDFFSGKSGDDQPNRTNNPKADGRDAEDDGDFVRVLEFYNLRDVVSGKRGDVYLGRLEVYVLDQPGEISKKPVVVLPLSFADADGRPLANLEPLIFANEPGFPLRPIAPVARILPQMVELNVLRTKMAEMVRRDARKGLARKGALEEDAMNKFLSSNDMEFAFVTDATVNLNDVAILFPHHPISADFKGHMEMVERDLTRVAGSSPAARGEITKATAFEVQQVQLFTESDLGFHGLLLNDCLTRVARLAQRAILGAMHDRGDSEGGHDAPGTHYASVGAIPGGKVPAGGDDADQAAGAVAADLQGDAAPAVSAEAASRTPEGVAPKDRGVSDDEDGVVVEAQSFTMRERDQTVEITVDGLDADFEITFVEGGRTPLTDQAMLQFLTGPGLQQYMALFQAVVKGGPEAVLAKATMAHLAERADLPRDMHPDELLAAVKKLPPTPPPPTPPPPAAGPPADAPPPQQEPPAGAPPTGGQAVLLNALQQVFGALKAVADLGPEAKAAVTPAGKAVYAATQAASEGAVDVVGEAVVAALEAIGAVDPATLPPEAAEPLAAALRGLQTIARAVAANTIPGRAPEAAVA